jgi:hypothetical protein
MEKLHHKQYKCKTFFHIPISSIDPAIYLLVSPASMPVSYLSKKSGWIQNLPLHDVISGNRTSLLVIIDLHLIVLVLLIIENRARSMNVGSCATHSNHLRMLEEGQLASRTEREEESGGIGDIR